MIKLKSEALNNEPVKVMGKQNVKNGAVEKSVVGRPRFESKLTARNLSLDEHDYNFLKTWCHSNGKNLSEVIRELIANKIEEIKSV